MTLAELNSQADVRLPEGPKRENEELPGGCRFASRPIVWAVRGRPHAGHHRAEES